MRSSFSIGSPGKSPAGVDAPAVTQGIGEDMIDLYTKIVLTVIAVALTLLVLQPLYVVKAAYAASADLSSIESYLGSVESRLRYISGGTCTNDKIC